MTRLWSAFDLKSDLHRIDVREEIVTAFGGLEAAALNNQWSSSETPRTRRRFSPKIREIGRLFFTGGVGPTPPWRVRKRL